MSSAPEAALRVDLQRPDGRWVAVGVLRCESETTTFSSFDEYWRAPSRPVLGQVFEQRGPGWQPTSSTALPIWFSNLLPEGRLREAIAEDAGVHEDREFPLLARIGGDDLPGALRTVAVDPGKDPLDASAEEPDTGDGSEAHPLKFSLDGVQLKFSVGETDRGLTVPASGYAGRWIAKLPDLRTGRGAIPEAEFAALELARGAGIEVPKTRLSDVSSISGLPPWATAGGGKALLVERFDRVHGDRVHAEELAQIMNVRPKRKYDRANFETVARFAGALAGPKSVAEVIDRVVLNVLVGNGDAHVKNWGFIYRDGITPELTPAYDVIPTVLYMPADDLGLNLNGSKEFADADFDAFARLADKAGWDAVSGRRRAVDASNRVIAAWPVLQDLLSAGQYAALTKRRDSLTGLLP